jgi:hypothetical protein
MHFMTCATSVDPDQYEHLCHLIRICTVYFLIRNNVINPKANSTDPDQMHGCGGLIWIYTVCPRHKGIYMEERVYGSLYHVQDKSN